MASELNFLKRGLSGSQISGLKGLAEKSADNWWKDVLESEDLLLAVRNGYLNAYVKGQSVFKIAFGKGSSDAGQPRLAIHYKYLVKPDLEKKDPYVSFDGKEFKLDPRTIVNTEYESKLTLPQLIKTAARFAGPEKSGVHKIARNEPKVIDLEIAFTKAAENGDLSAPRMDIAVLVQAEPGKAELVFCEAKCADNPELWGLEKLPKGVKSHPPSERLTAVIAQVRKYEQFIQTKEIQESLIEGYVRVCMNLVEISEQSPGRRVDDLVKRVAEGKLELSIHPHVYLLIYDFGEDEKKGRIKNKRLELKKAGVRTIAKGDPGAFELANDVVRARTEWTVSSG
ncbi:MULTISPECIES: hypothetical protein [Bradyrhizobium]|uniref:hypothetical protein n=1 Tax=Bradyrhizobium TaxID=374 RepID=UPI0012606630|nr:MULTISPECIES: hypothetical protein [Bradyrhizobium]BBO12581.1 hypothetical protein TM102_40510 [Bradyrhizobium sp. TM102]